MTPLKISRPLIYLASPHSHPQVTVRHLRYVQVVKAAACLMKQGKMVFCPIAHSHPIHHEMMKLGASEPEWNFYREFDTKILSICDELWVLTLDGWKDSRGIKGEIEFASLLPIPIRYVDYEIVCRRAIDSL